MFNKKKNKKFQNTREVITYVAKYISGRVLDLGAGKGKYKSIIAPKAEKYTAMDIKPGENVDVVGDIMDLPFANESFDTIICTQVLEHIDKPWQAVKEIKAALSKNGICILTAPFLIPSHSDPNDYFRFTYQGLESLFKNEGFEVIESDYYCQSFSVLSEWFRFVFSNPYQPQNWLKRRIAEYAQKLSKFLDRFTKNKIIYGNAYIIAKKRQNNKQ